MSDSESDGRLQEKDGKVEEALAGENWSLAHEITFVFTICVAQALSLAGLSQTIVPLNIIGEDLGILQDPGRLSWLTAGYSLTVGTFILPAGRLGDLYGHKLLYLIGFAWFGLWSLISGFSVYSGYIMLSVCRGLQGIGPAILVPNALALMGRQYKAGSRKNLAFSFFGAAAPLGFSLGAVFTAIYAQLAWWPWSFWTLGVACWIVMGLAYFVLPADVQKNEHAKQEPAQEKEEKGKPDPGKDNDTDAPPMPSSSTFDYWGCLVGVVGLVLFNFAWNQAAVVGWEQPYTYALLIVSIAVLAGFVYIETRVATDPILPFGAFSFNACLALGCVAAGWASFGIWLYYQWRLYEYIRGDTALSGVAQTSPVVVSGLVAALLTGWLLSKTKPAYILLAAMLFFIAGMTLLATLPLHQIYWGQLFVSICIMPWGMDMSFPSGTIIVSNGMAAEHQGLAASLVNTIVNYSISVGLGMAGTIERYVTQNGGASDFEAYRAAWYFGIGLDVLGLAIAVYFVIRTRLDNQKTMLAAA